MIICRYRDFHAIVSYQISTIFQREKQEEDAGKGKEEEREDG